MTGLIRRRGSVVVAVAAWMSLVATPGWSAQPARDEQVMERDYFGCRTEDQFSTASAAMIQRDGKPLATYMLAGQCTTLSRGTRLVLTDITVLRGLVKVRRKGETEAWWTLVEFVKKAN